MSWSIALIAVSTLAVAASPPAAKDGQATTVESLKGKDGAPMILIPGGPFTMGSNDGLPNERPEHLVELDPYYIDQYEVTLALYRKFLESGNHESPPTWDDEAATTVGDRPAIGMKWADAEAYCKWAGKRLPTEAEWEKAARGPNGLLFPWGDRAPDSERAMFGQHHVHEIPILAAVDSHDAGRSPYGLHHMAGNVAEWVQDWFGLDYYAYMPGKNPIGPASGRYRGVRGGSWKSKVVMLRTATRSGFAPDQRSATIGFRCAQSSTNGETGRP
jgi:iron(II)-dependent oxidoreductase